MSGRPARVEAIIMQVAARHGLARADLVGPCRKRTIVRARQQAMGEVRALSLIDGRPHSTTAIGRWFGGRDHSTVSRALRRLAEMDAA